MKTERITVEKTLFVLAILLALGLRLWHLGQAPLSDFEASWALQALHLSRGDSLSLGPSPGYVLLTGLIFFLFGSSNMMARLWPAIAGTLLVGLPWLLRAGSPRRAESAVIDRNVAIILAFGLALDPGLVALSRLAGGPMLALAFGLFALGCAYVRRPVWAGVFGGLALLGGPAVLQGGLILLILWAAGELLGRLGRTGLSPDWQPLSTRFDHSARNGLIAAGGTVLLAGTLFLSFPQGLGALASIIPAYLAGWVTPSGVPAARLLAAWIVYEPLALVFGLTNTVRGWSQKDERSILLSLWALFALILALLYPGRQASALVWVIVPLWALAALEIACQLHIESGERLPALGQGILIFILLALGWLNLAGLSQSGGDLQVYRLRWAVILGTLALGAVTTILVGLGWSASAAQRGLSWGLGAALFIYTISSLWGVSQLHPNGEQELWTPPPATDQAKQLIETLGDLSEWKTGRRDAIDILAVAPAPSLEWLLHDWEQVEYASDINAEKLPAVILAPESAASPSLAAAYRGQDFAWQVYPNWSGALPPDWAEWLVFKKAPQRIEHIILWARADVFPGGTLIPGGDTNPSSSQEETNPGEGGAK
jgi:hypothetical protein